MTGDTPTLPGAIKVLLVEDHALVRSATRTLLSQDAQIVIVGETDNAGDASVMVESLRPDLVITDIRLRNSNGFDLTKAVKRAHPEIKVLVLTAYEYEQYLHAMSRAGADGYLLKLVSAEELRGSVHGICAGDIALAESMDIPEQAAEGSIARETLVRSLTSREIEILELVQASCNTQEIADRLHLSRKTVYTHLSRIESKLGTSNPVGSLDRAENLGIIRPVAESWFSRTMSGTRFQVAGA